MGRKKKSEKLSKLENLKELVKKLDSSDDLYELSDYCIELAEQLAEKIVEEENIEEIEEDLGDEEEDN